MDQDGRRGTLGGAAGPGRDAGDVGGAGSSADAGGTHDALLGPGGARGLAGVPARTGAPDLSGSGTPRIGGAGAADITGPGAGAGGWPEAGGLAGAGGRLPVMPGFREMALRRMSRERGRLMRELAARRQQTGLSQTEIAARMGTSQSAVARLESGGADARASTLERYAAALGTEITWAVQD